MCRRIFFCCKYNFKKCIFIIKCYKWFVRSFIISKKKKLNIYINMYLKILKIKLKLKGKLRLVPVKFDLLSLIEEVAELFKP